MADRKTQHTKKELLELGFEPVVEGGYKSFQYVFDKTNYFSSGALVTSEVKEDVELTNDSTFTVQLSGVKPEVNLGRSAIRILIKELTI